MKSTATPLRRLLSEHTRPSAPGLVRAEATGRDPDAVRCLACGHRCMILEGRHGVCHVRFNRAGTLMAPAGYVAAVQVDPIEKKPFFHAYPGRDALSFGMMGCDYHCSYCQNWVTSQALRDDRAIARIQLTTPEDLTALALEHGAPVMVSTYNEPLITCDWAVEVFKAARGAGIVCGFISNGNATPEALEYIRPYVDLYKVDLKGFTDKSYRDLGGVLSNVLDTIRRLHQMDFWVEIVTLLVPGFNDGDDELKAMAGFLAGVSTGMPWHVTAFHPDYKMTEPERTPAATLLRARDIGLAAGLKFVYAGNLPGITGGAEDTACPQCGQVLIRRRGFVVTANHLAAGRCPACSAEIPGRWEADAPRASRGSGMPLPILLNRAGSGTAPLRVQSP